MVTFGLLLIFLQFSRNTNSVTSSNSKSSAKEELQIRAQNGNVDAKISLGKTANTGI